jgi:hypothetical protein
MQLLVRSSCAAPSCVFLKSPADKQSHFLHQIKLKGEARCSQVAVIYCMPKGQGSCRNVWATHLHLRCISCSKKYAAVFALEDAADSWAVMNPPPAAYNKQRERFALKLAWLSGGDPGPLLTGT